MSSLNPFQHFSLYVISNMPSNLANSCSPTNFLGSFLRSQFTTLPYPTHDFSSQTIIITGANVGLGLEAARHFVRLNAARVILACRSLEKGEAARLDIETTTGRKGVLEVWQVDLTSYDSVKEFCKKVRSLDRLDAVIENAGLATPTFELVEGSMSCLTLAVSGWLGSTYLGMIWSL